MRGLICVLGGLRQMSVPGGEERVNGGRVVVVVLGWAMVVRMEKAAIRTECLVKNIWNSVRMMMNLEQQGKQYIYWIRCTWLHVTRHYAVCKEEVREYQPTQD